MVEVIADSLPNTLLLLLTAYLPAFTVGALLGAYAIKKEFTKIDVSLTVLMLGLWSTPVYWLGILSILFFSLYLGWFPTSGMYSIARGTVGWAGSTPDLLWHMCLPAICLILVNIPTFQQIARTSVAEVIKEDYITAARARGLSEKVVFYKHALRNGMLPVVTKASMWLSAILAGSVLTETVFAWPGMGRLMYDSIFSRDYPLTMGIFMITTMTVMIGTLITDILYAYLDPRIQLR